MEQKQPPEVFCKQRCSEKIQKFTGKHRASFQAEAFNFIKKETVAQVFSCEICEISRNTFLTEHIRATASDGIKLLRRQ